MKDLVRKSLITVLALVVCFSLVGCSSSETKGGEPKQATANLDGKIIGIACLASGTANNVIAEALAAAITKNTPMTARAEPSSGPSSWLGSLERGEIEFGLASDFDLYKAFAGDPKIYDRAYKNIRLVKIGPKVNKGSLVVAKDSPIKSITDLVGKKVAIEVPAQPSLQATTEALLVGAGVDLNNIQKVKIENMNDGCRAVTEGRADAALGTLNSGGVEELNAAVGARYLAANITPEGLTKAREVFPGADEITIKAGPTGVEQDMPFIAWGITLVTSEDVPDEIVYAVAKALYENYDSFKDAHPAMKAYTPENSVSPLLPVPVHEAAIKYYKEVNLWSQEVEKAHNDLLAMK